MRSALLSTVLNNQRAAARLDDSATAPESGDVGTGEGDGAALGIAEQTIVDDIACHRTAVSEEKRGAEIDDGAAP
jgi:hypothetical protein